MESAESSAVIEQPPMARLPNELLEEIFLHLVRNTQSGVAVVARLAITCSRFRRTVERIVYRSVTASPGLPFTPERLLLLARTSAENAELASLMSVVDLRRINYDALGRARRHDWSFARWRRPLYSVVQEAAETLTQLSRIEPCDTSARMQSQKKAMAALQQPGGHSAVSVLLAALAPHVHTACLPHVFDWRAVSQLLHTPIVFPQLTSLTWSAGRHYLRRGDAILDLIAATPNLRRLSLRRLHLSPPSRYLPSITSNTHPRLSQLTSLHLEDCHLDTPGLGSLLATCTSLETLVLTRRHDRRLDTLDFLPPAVTQTLRRLCLACTPESHILSFWKDPDPIPTTPRACVQAIRSMPNLTHLTLGQCYACYHDATCSWLGNLVTPQLEVLQVMETRGPELGGGHLEYLAGVLGGQGFPSLKRVQLTPFGDGREEKRHWKELKGLSQGYGERLKTKGVQLTISGSGLGPGYLPGAWEAEEGEGW